MKPFAAALAVLMLGSVASLAPPAVSVAFAQANPVAGEDGAARAPAPRRPRGDQNVGPCPLLGVLYDSHRMVEFKGAEAFQNVSYSGEIRGVRGLCRYRGDDPIEMTLDIDMAFGKGPAAQGDSHTYRYWVAVTRKDLAPISRQVFEKTVKFDDADRMAGSEKIERIVIPRAKADTSGVNFEILVGFELTPEQLAYNRAGKRFRVDAGS